MPILFLIFALLASTMMAQPPLLASAARETTNPDGSVTVWEPKILRGETKYWISYRASDPKGICKLFGYESYLDITRRQSGDLSEPTINIDASGAQTGFTNYGNEYNSKIDALTCYNGTAPKLVFRRKRQDTNPDGSTTIGEPTASRGDTNYWISHTSDLNSICAAFGLDSFLDSTLESSGDLQTTIVVGKGSVFQSYKAYGNDYNKKVDELTCQQGGKPSAPIYFSDNIKRNPDGSTSIHLPKVKRGDNVFLVSGNSSSEGVCLAFGYSAVLGSTLFTSGDHQVTAMVSAHGTHAGFKRYGNEYNTQIDHLACYQKESPPSLVAEFREKKQNPDGSTTVIQPKVKRGNGTFVLSSRSDLDGVCRLYGLKKFMSDTLKQSGDHQITLRIDGSSRYSGFVKYGNEYNQQIDSLVCY